MRHQTWGGSTVATWVKRFADIDAASGQLGHVNKTVTQEHYIEHKTVGPDVRPILDRLAPPMDARVVDGDTPAEPPE